MGASFKAGSGAVAGLVAAVGVLAAAAPALAGETANPASTPTNVAAFSRIDMMLAGRISARCDLSGGGDIDLGELAGGLTVRARVGLDCNVPFDLSFQSARGGLAHAVHPAGEGPYAGTLGYTLDVRVPVVDPRVSTLHGRYESKALTAPKTLNSGDAIAAGDARIEIRTRPPEGVGLLAGRYAETLTITVASRL